MTVSTDFSKKKILIVEDDAQLADIMKNYIQGLGFEVDVLYNAYKVVERVENDGYVLAFLDVLIPGQTGLDLLRELRQHEHGKTIPMVMLTNVKDENKQKEAMDLGAADYLIKVDTDLEKLKEVINQLVR